MVLTPPFKEPCLYPRARTLTFILIFPSKRDRLLHGDQHHLMGNMFNLVIFGKMAEEDMGPVGACRDAFVALGWPFFIGATAVVF